MLRERIWLDSGPQLFLHLFQQSEGLQEATNAGLELAIHGLQMESQFSDTVARPACSSFSCLATPCFVNSSSINDELPEILPNIEFTLVL